MFWEYSSVIKNYHAVGTGFCCQCWKNKKKFMLCTDSVKARLAIAHVLIKLTFQWRDEQACRYTIMGSALREEAPRRSLHWRSGSGEQRLPEESDFEAANGMNIDCEGRLPGAEEGRTEF